MKTQRKSRIKELIDFDRSHGSFIIGTDEAGRGPIAGPVVAGAVYFPEINNEIINTIKLIDDSKSFSSSPKLRKELAELIKTVALYSISECSIEEIERYNILQASLTAMKRSCNDIFLQLETKTYKTHTKNYKTYTKTNKPEEKSGKKSGIFTKNNKNSGEIIILVDGNFIIPGYRENQKAVKKGDALSVSIAAASILAKVYRDSLMEKLAEEYPVYEWHKNKGYGTSAHIRAIRTHGPCKWHRKSFLGKILAEK